MPVVFLPTALRQAGGLAELTVAGSTVREVVENLDREVPGIRDHLLENGRLKEHVAIAIDGKISNLGLLERIADSAEIHFVPAISGGCTFPLVD